MISSELSVSWMSGVGYHYFFSLLPGPLFPYLSALSDQQITLMKMEWKWICFKCDRQSRCHRDGNVVGPSVLTSLFVDDIAISFGSQDSDYWTLTPGYYSLSYWALENIFSFPAAKTQCLSFTHLWDLHPHPSFFLNNSALLFAPSIRILSLILLKTLSWELHLRRLTRRGHQTWAMDYSENGIDGM
jgi:hypothetical protein